MLNRKQNINEFEKTNEADLNFVTGGAKVDENIGENFKETFNTKACDCGCFQPYKERKSSLDICDNCIWARAPKENTTVTYCTKQKI